MKSRFRLFFSPYSEAKLDVFLFAIRVAIFTGFGTLIISYLLSKISALLLEWDISGFEQLIYGFGITLFFYYIFVFLMRHTGFPNMRAKVWVFIHRRYVRMVCELDNNYAETVGSSRLFSIIDKWGQAWADALKSLFQEFSRVIIIGVPTIFLLAKQSISIIGIFILIFLFGSFVIFVLNKKLRKYKLARVKSVMEYDRNFIRAIQSRLEITQSLSFERNLTLLDECNENYRVPFQKQVGVQMLMFQWARIVSYIILIILYWILGHQYLEAGSITLPHLILLASLTGTLNGLFFDITELYMNLSDQIVSIEQLWTKIEDAPKTENLFSGESFVYRKWEIHFQNVDFSYIEDAPILRDFSYIFEAGKKYALVGPSGWGKTTVMKLASGFLSAKSGKVTVDNFDLSKVNLSTFYPNIGYLTQDPQIFDGTIRENLVQGKTTEFQDTDIVDALNRAQAEFVFTLPEWLDTEIGERGVKLSGGQKQRLAIAKIFLKNPHIIFLDEPTSALDSFSEEKISEAFHTLFEWRTVIIIAHRLQTVKEADVIMVLENGQVSEQWKHDELITQWWVYARMLELQSGF